MLTKLQHRNNLQTIIIGWRELVKSFLLRTDLTRTEKQQLNMIQYLLGTLLYDWDFNTRYGGCRTVPSFIVKELPPIDPEKYFHPDGQVMVDGEFAAKDSIHAYPWRKLSKISEQFTGGEA